MRTDSTIPLATRGNHPRHGRCYRCGRRVWRWCVANFLPISLVLLTIFGAVYPDPGRYMNDETPANIICIVIIFLITGIKLKTAEIKNAIGAWRSWVFGSISILFITPILALGLIHLPLAPDDLSFGFALLANMPTTISSGVMLVKEAKGNAPLALLMCLITNIVCIFTIPFIFPILLNTGSVPVKVDAPKLLMNLSLTILVPLIVGKILHDSSDGVRRWSRRKRVDSALKFITTILLTVMPWMNISVSVDKLATLTAGTLFACIGWMLAMHIAYIIFHIIIMKILPLNANRQNTKAVVIMASQKSPTILFSVLAFLPDSLGSKGLIAIPAIICQLVQIIMDSVVASQWAKSLDPEQEEAQREWLDSAPRLSPRGSRRESIDLDAGRKKKSKSKSRAGVFGGRRRSFDEEDDDTASASGHGRTHLGNGDRRSSNSSNTSAIAGGGVGVGVFGSKKNAFSRLGDDDDDDDSDHHDHMDGVTSRDSEPSSPRAIVIDPAHGTHGHESVAAVATSGGVHGVHTTDDNDEQRGTAKLTASSGISSDSDSKSDYRTFNE